VNELINCKDRTDKRAIEKILFSGRSTKFPKVKSAVKTRLKEILGREIVEIPLNPKGSVDELKTAVAQGACWYGINHRRVELKNNKIFGNYGTKRTINAHENIVAFEQLIPTGVAFGDLEMVKGSKKYAGTEADRYGNDNNFVKFYQVFGSEPAEILKKNIQHKINLIQIFRETSPLHYIQIEISKTDEITCRVVENTGERNPLQITDRNLYVQESELTVTTAPHYYFSAINE
jgi:hypothetical protein